MAFDVINAVGVLVGIGISVYAAYTARSAAKRAETRERNDDVMRLHCEAYELHARLGPISNDLSQFILDFQSAATTGRIDDLTFDRLSKRAQRIGDGLALLLTQRSPLQTFQDFRNRPLDGLSILTELRCELNTIEQDLHRARQTFLTLNP